MKIIGLTGTIGAGKGLVAEYFRKKYFKHYSVREFLASKVIERGLPLERASYVVVANALRRQAGPAGVIELLVEEAFKEGKNCVIESLRTLGEIEYLRGKQNFTLLAVDADQKTRYNRIYARKLETDNISFEQFVRDENKEMSSEDPNEQNLSGCIKEADFVVQNDGTTEELFKKLDEVLEKLK